LLVVRRRVDNPAVHHIRAAVRAILRAPTAFLLSAGVLAVGIGLASAMLAVLNGTLWHALPFPTADRLVALAGPVTAQTVADWSAASRSYDAIAGYRNKRYSLTGRGDAVSLRATVATGDLFRLLDAKAAAGRVLGVADDRGEAAALVLSDECRRSVFHDDPGLIGRSILLNGTPFVVVGVMPPGFRFPVDAEPSDVYTTVAADRQTDRAASREGRPRDLSVVGRLAPGVTLQQARAEFSALWFGGRKDAADAAEKRRAVVVPLAETVVAPVASPVTALAWSVAGVVVVACVTTAILSLIRVSSRRAEWATRLALGATPGDLVRQVLGETALTALAGGAAGAVVALAGVQPLIDLSGAAVGAVARPRFDATVWSLTAAAAGLAALASGLFPALHAASAGWSVDAGRPARGTRAASAVRNILVVTEVALAVMLLAACISLLRAYSELSGVDIGFQPRSVLTFRVDLPESQYPPGRRVELFERLREAATATRGVVAAGFSVLPPFGDIRFTIGLPAPGETSKGARSGAEVHLVSAGHFQALGIPMVSGRDFGAADNVDGSPVVIVSRALASRQFGASDPIGQTLDVRPGALARGPLPRVVGVVGDIRNGRLVEPGEPQVYVPYAQAPMLASATFLVRVTDDARPVMGEIRRHLTRLDPTIAPVSVRPLGELVSSATALPRFASAVAGVFASAAVFLAMSGLYSVVAYAALCRRREFSIRRALGATEWRIARLVFGHTAGVVLPGLCLGAAGAAAAGRLLEHALFGVHPSPLSTIAVTVVSAAWLAAFAAWWPARAAGRDDLRARLQASG
jgi:putative ABC transport system permease protein